jgi:hypothetical protein
VAIDFGIQHINRLSLLRLDTEASQSSTLLDDFEFWMFNLRYKALILSKQYHRKNHSLYIRRIQKAILLEIIFKKHVFSH